VQVLEQMARAINLGDREEVLGIVSAHPEQRYAHTLFCGTTWLGYAAGQGNLAAVKALVEAGADVNQGGKYESTAPICWAAKGHEDVVRFLLEQGARLDTASPIVNPLFWAVSHWQKADQTEIVLMLLRAGIDSRAAYPYKSRKKAKADLDAVSKAFLWGTPIKAGVVAAWNCRSRPEDVRAVLEAAQLASLSHVPQRKLSPEKQSQLDEKVNRILETAYDSAIRVLPIL
jgi:ankyrin repeat protein